MHVKGYVNSTSIKRKFELTAVEENVLPNTLTIADVDVDPLSRPKRAKPIKDRTPHNVNQNTLENLLLAGLRKSTGLRLIGGPTGIKI